MAINLAENLARTNPNQPIVSGSDLKGNIFPIDVLANTGSIPSGKREVGITIFTSASGKYYGFTGDDVANWDTPSNWSEFVLSGAGGTDLSGTFSGSFSGSFEGNGSGLTNVDYNNLDNVPSGIVSGSSQVVSLLPAGTVSGSSQVVSLLPAGTVSGSSQVDYNSISNVPSGIVSGSSQVVSLLPAGTVSGSSQVTLGGDLTGTANNATVGAIQNVEITAAEAEQLANIGSTTISSTQWGYLGVLDQNVRVGSDVSFANGIFTGDLTVQGTVTSLQTQNLNVEDQFILLNSGSSEGDSGLIFGGANGTAQQGPSLFWNSSYNTGDGRLAVTSSLAWNATEISNPDYYLAGVFEGAANAAATAKADHVGNIRVESGEIYIYV